MKPNCDAWEGCGLRTFFGTDFLVFGRFVCPRVRSARELQIGFAPHRRDIEVKCEANPPKKEVKLRLAVTDKENPKMLKEFRGPVVHNFSEANICNMKVPHCDEEWDLPYDNTEPTFLVRLEIYDEDDDSD